MSKLPSSEQITRVLLRHGFVFISQRGSHAKYRRISDRVHTVIVPANRKEVPIGTLISIVRQSGLDRADFV